MLNKVQLIGNLGRDPEVRNFSNGMMVTFSMATTENWKDRDGEWQSKTEWHNIVTYGYAAKAAERLSKGDQVYIEGGIYTTKKDDKYYTNIKANTVRKLGRSDRGGQNEDRYPDPPEESYNYSTGDDVPF